MESLEARIERIEYYQSLLTKIIDTNQFSFYKLIMEANLTKKEVEDLLSICEDLSIQYKKQKAEGFVNFTPLLTQFAGQLHPNLNVEDTVNALLKQYMFTPLMNEFNKILTSL